jgi:hypothetical protein
VPKSENYAILEIFDIPGSKKLHVKNGKILDLILFPISLWTYAKKYSVKKNHIIREIFRIGRFVNLRKMFKFIPTKKVRKL